MAVGRIPANIRKPLTTASLPAPGQYRLICDCTPLRILYNNVICKPCNYIYTNYAENGLNLIYLLLKYLSIITNNRYVYYWSPTRSYYGYDVYH